MRKPAVCCLLAMILAFAAANCWACSAQGPQDPLTGLIAYPPGAGNGVDSTVIPSAGLAGTPFAGGTYYKGWAGSAMKLLIVPSGSKIAFQGVIQSTAINPPRPEYWEEGEVNRLYGTTVENAPRPAWTISGNGRGDWNGQAPPTIAGVALKPFEQAADCMIVDDTPAVKARWELTYDQNAALNMLGMAYNDPTYAAMINSSLPGVDFLTVLNNARAPQNSYGATGLNRYIISPAGPGGADAVRAELRRVLPHAAGLVNAGAAVTRRFSIPGTTNGSYTMTLPASERFILKAGYIAMQEWYPTGAYDTKYFVTPPSGDTQEYGASKHTQTFDSPTVPDFWTIDLQSGLQSAKDCVWCWIEGERTLKPANTAIPQGSPRDAYFALNTDSLAVGGVFVQGLYSNGGSSAGRNTLIYVVVVDTEKPNSFEWLAGGAGLDGEAGKKLADVAQPGGMTSLKVRVYDNNPVIGATAFGNIHSKLTNLASYQFVKANEKPRGGANVAEVYTKYVEPVKSGYDSSMLSGALAYNVCVPAYLGLTAQADAQEKYQGPIPLVQDRLVLPAQRFVWKQIPKNLVAVTNRLMYDRNGRQVSIMKDLYSEPDWRGYSSFDLEIPLANVTEPMGSLFAGTSRRYDVAFADLFLNDPGAVLGNGIPIVAGKVQYYGFDPKAIKLFPIAADGVGNQTPTAAEVDHITGTRLSGLPLARTAQPDLVSLWNDPASLDGTITPTPIVGGALGANLPTGGTSATWGVFANVKTIADKGKPNIALEILNSKNEKRVVYGNLWAAGSQAGYWQAMERAGQTGWAVTVDSNIGNADYTSAGTEHADSRWEFQAKLDEEMFLPFQRNLDAGRFRPWLFAVPDNTNVGLPIWGANYWNGQAAYNNDRIAYQQGSRDRLVFRYWTWDNINMFDSANSTTPNGVTRVGGDPRFTGVCPAVPTARVTMTDQPVYSATGGQVPDSVTWWPDYIFHNPSHRSGGAYEECSLRLDTTDESGNTRALKVFFRVIAPSVEIIRTLEDNRQRR